MHPIITQLLNSEEPSIRYKIRTGVLGEDPNSPEIKSLRDEIRSSARVTGLLSQRGENGAIPGGVYRKWNGAHWVLAQLADIGYPPGDESLAPMVDQVCACWLSDRHVESVPVVNGRARRCGSQEGNALYAMMSLGFIDERADRLAENLIRWQWPDGGWNCDKRPPAAKSSFHETWIPVRALSLYGRMTGSAAALESAARGAEVFLTRRLFRRISNGNVIKPTFLQLSYPPYWHYCILNGLKVMVEAGFIGDERCAEALDILESKRLPDGGFPAQIQHHKTSPSNTSTYSTVKWGPRGMNEWVTAEALSILMAAGRLTANG